MGDTSDEAARLLPPALAAHRGPFAGRQQALSILRSARERTRSGRNELVVVTGAAGMGKSRLSRELALEAVSAGAEVLAGRCDEDAAEPYRPWRDALGGRAAALDAAPGAQPGVEQERVVVAVVALLEAAVRQQGLVLVLDDLQWSDAPSLRLLRSVLRQTTGVPLLVLATCRDEAAPTLRQTLADIRRDRVFDRVDLAPLTVDDVAVLVESEGLHRVSVASPVTLARRVHQRSGGHPLLTAELLRHLRDGGDDRVLPTGIRDTVAARARLLGGSAYDVLQRVAVLGLRFDARVASQVVDRPDGEVREALDAALAAGIVVEEHATGGLAFAHALVRDALHEELPALERRRLHARAVQALEEAGAPAAVLAVHARAGGADPAAAVRLSLAAADEAASAFAVEEAITHLEAARQLLATAGEDRLLASSLVRLGDLTYSSGIRYGEGLEHLEQAVHVYERLGDRVAAAKARSRLGRALSTYFDWMDLPAAVGQLEEAERVLREEGEERALAAVLVALSNARYWTRELTRALCAAEEAEQLAEQGGGGRTLALARAMRGRLLCHRGALAEGTDLLEHAWRTAQREHLVDVAYSVTVFAATIARQRFDLEGAEAVLRRGLAFPSLDAAPWQREQLHLFLASVEIARGDVLAAQQRLPHVGVNRPVIEEYELALSVGDWDRAHASSEHFLELNGTRQHQYPVVFPLLLEEQPELLAYLEQELRRSDEDVLAQLCTRSAVALGLARTWRVPEAQEHVAVARTLLTGEQDWGGLPAAVQLVEAELAVAGGDADRALSLAGGARAAFAGRGARWLEAEALVTSARAAVNVDPELARRAVTEAVALYRGVGAGGRWEQRAEQVLRRRSPGAVVAASPAASSGRRGAFRRAGEFWTVGLDGATVAVRDSKGMRVLGVLLANPGRDVPAVELEALTADTSAAPADLPFAAAAGDAGPLLDEQARNAYRERLHAIEAALEDADVGGDSTRSRELHAERAALIGELKRATGLGGRSRRAAATDERARLNVTRAVRSAVRRIHRLAPEVALHLDDALVTGRACSYRPTASVHWDR